jgi:hypothetical protein
LFVYLFIYLFELAHAIVGLAVLKFSGQTGNLVTQVQIYVAVFHLNSTE